MSVCFLPLYLKKKKSAKYAFYDFLKTSNKKNEVNSL